MTTERELPELLPCPFCGGEPEVCGVASNGWFMACRTKGCVNENVSQPDRAALIAAWNTRPSLAADAVGEAVAWMVRYVGSDNAPNKDWQPLITRPAQFYFDMPESWEVRPLYLHPAPQSQPVAEGVIEAANRMMEFADSEYVPNIAFARLKQALSAQGVNDV